jgi:hypothetical protein
MDVDEFPEENKPYSPRQVDEHDEQVSQSVDSVHYNFRTTSPCKLYVSTEQQVHIDYMSPQNYKST